ncbi:hypothetical protein FI667_g8481, partial [Globisporangium splendens]
MLSVSASIRVCGTMWQCCNGVIVATRVEQHVTNDDVELGVFESLASWFGSSSDSGISANKRDKERGNNEVERQVEELKIALQFPDHPEWYGNAVDCHTVFALFSQRLECSCCGGFFCNADLYISSTACSSAQIGEKFEKHSSSGSSLCVFSKLNMSDFAFFACRDQYTISVQNTIRAKICRLVGRVNHKLPLDGTGPTHTTLSLKRQTHSRSYPVKIPAPRQWRHVQRLFGIESSAHKLLKTWRVRTFQGEVAKRDEALVRFIICKWRSRSEGLETRIQQFGTLDILRIQRASHKKCTLLASQVQDKLARVVGAKTALDVVAASSGGDDGAA